MAPRHIISLETPDGSFHSSSVTNAATARIKQIIILTLYILLGWKLTFPSIIFLLYNIPAVLRTLIIFYPHYSGGFRCYFLQGLC